MQNNPYRIMILCLFAAAALISCKQPLQPATNKTGTATDQGSGSLTVSFEKATSKNLLPSGDLAISSFDLVLTKSGSTSIEQDGLAASRTTVGPIVLETGVWTVTINGRNAAKELIASGTNTATIKPAATTSVPITVTPLTGNGILSLTATLGTGVAQNPSIAGTLVPVGGGSPIALTMALSTDKTSASYETTTIPAGWYTLTIALSDGGTVVARSEPEAVQIAAGRRTQGPISFAFDPSLGRVVVSITLIMDDPITITLSGNSSYLVLNKSMTVNASTSEPVTSYRWFIDNTEIIDTTGASLIIQGSIGVGNHRLGLVVSNNSRVSSTTVFFTVVPIPTFTITYDGNGQTGGTIPIDSTLYHEGDNVIVPGNTGSLTKTSLYFAGWNTKADGTGVDYPVASALTMGSADIKLYVKWMVLPSYTISFDCQSGSAVSQVYAQQIASFPESSRSGYALEGWYPDATFVPANKISFPYTPPSDMTLVAKWIPATDGLAYISNGPGYTVSKGTASTIGIVTIPEYWLGKSVTSIGYSAFDCCSGLTSLTIPGSVTSIGTCAFRSCSGLTSLTIPSGVTSIGDDAFYGCSGLTSLTIPGSVTSIGNYAFYECLRLTTLTIPGSVTSIGDRAFDGCPGLTSLTIQSGVTSIGYAAFGECSGLTSLTIPNSVTSIGGQAFYDCSRLTSLTIPSSVTSIGGQAFSFCSGLTSLTIQTGVTSIGGQAFSFCSGLTSLTIPSSVTSIGDRAFENCYDLTSVTVDPITPPLTGPDLFSTGSVSSNLASIKVPAGSVDAYKAAAGWSAYSSLIISQ